MADLIKATDSLNEGRKKLNAIAKEMNEKDVISAPELIAARNGESNLKTRLDDEHAQVTAQLAQKASKESLGQTNTEVSGLDQRIDNLVIPISTENTNVEVTDAHVSVPKGMQFDSINDRFEEIENDWISAKDNIYQFVFKYGNEYVDLTGGFVEGYTKGTYTGNGFRVEEDRLNILMNYSVPNVQTAGVMDSPVDLTDVENVYVDYEVPSASSGFRSRFVIDRRKQGHIDNRDVSVTFLGKVTRRIIKVDVSDLTGFHYIRMHGYGTDSTGHGNFNVYQIFTDEKLLVDGDIKRNIQALNHGYQNDFNRVLLWEEGGLNDGENHDNLIGRRLRTKGFIDDSSIKTLRTSGDLSFTMHEYTKDGVWTQGFDWSDERSEELDFSNFKYRLNVRKGNGNSGINMDAVDNIHFYGDVIAVSALTDSKDTLYFRDIKRKMQALSNGYQNDFNRVLLWEEGGLKDGENEDATIGRRLRTKGFIDNPAIKTIKATGDVTLVTHEYTKDGVWVQGFTWSDERSDELDFNNFKYRLHIRKGDGTPSINMDAVDSVYFYGDKIALGELTELEVAPYFVDEFNQTKEEFLSVYRPDNLNYLWVSDTHVINDVEMERMRETLIAINVLSEETPIDFIVFGGDVVNHGDLERKYVIEIAELLSQAKVPVYFLNGNHDELDRNVWAYYTSNVNKLGEPNFPDLCRYYFEDVEHKNKRLIFLDSSDSPEGTLNTHWGFTETQINWFIDTLTNTPNDKDVAVFSHIPPKEDMNYMSSHSVALENTVNHIYQAFNNHSSGTYEEAGLSFAYDFSDKTNKIVINHSGHKHIDFLAHFPDENMFYVVTAAATTTRPTTVMSRLPEFNERIGLGVDVWRGYDSRPIGTKDEACFDIISVNKEKLNRIRFGVGTNQEWIV